MNSKPYIGAQPFQESDRERFFGRDQEANELLALALSEQEIVFYAQSGAGKSSLVNTCLIPDLKKKGFEVLLGRVGGDAPSGLETDNIFAFNLLRSLSTPDADINNLANQTLSGFLVPEADSESASAGRASPRRALIIDQFEEIFSRHHEAWEKRGKFFEQLAQVLEDDPRLRVILVMREDFIAALDPYANLLPSRLRMRYFMQRLEYPAALKAVTEPVKRKEFSRPYDSGAAEKLVDDLRTIKVIKPDGTSDVGVGQFVEPLYLQVICDELWNKLPEGGTTITKQNILDVGDVGTALMNLYASSMERVAKEENISEAKIRKWFTDKLISPAGIRNMVLQESGETSANLENRVIRALSDLVRAEQRGGAVFYELTHDRLAQPIITSNRIWFEEHLSALQKQAALWDAQGKTDSWLLINQALVEVEQWAKDHGDELTDIEKDFLEACQKQQEQIIAEREAQRRELEMAQKLADEQAHFAQQQALANQRIRKALRVSTIIAGIASLFLVIAISLGIQSYQNQRTKQMQVLINASAIELSKGNAENATLLAYQALVNYGDYGEVEQALADILANVKKQPREDRVEVPAPFIIVQSASVISLAFNPADEGKTLALSYSNGNLFLVDVAKRQLIGQPLMGHTAQVNSVAYSPDGKILASGSEDGTIILWDVATHQPISQPLTGHTDSVTSVAFSPNGKTLASGSWDNTIMLWDLVSPQPIGQPLTGHTGVVTSVAFNPDGTKLVSGSYDHTIIVWDVATQKPIGQPLTGHTGVVTSVAFNPDGKTLASGSWDTTIILWDVATGQSIGKPLTGHIDWVKSLAFSPEGKTLASASDDSNIILWNVATHQQIDQPLSGHNGYINSVTFSPDGTTLASGSDDSNIILWDIATRQPIGEPITTLVSENMTKVDLMYLTTDGDILATNYSVDTGILWNAKSGKQTNVEGINSYIRTENYTWSAGNNKIIIRNSSNNKEVARINFNRKTNVSKATLSPDGERIAIAYYDDKSTVEIWDIQSQQKILVIANRQLENLGYTVVSPSSLLNKSLNASGASAKEQKDLQGNPVADLLYSQDGHLYILYYSGVIDRWDIWPSRTELKQYAEAEVCDTCELSYDQRLEYELYTWPMRVHDYAGYIIVLVNLACYGYCTRKVYRTLFVRSIAQNRMPDRTWKKLWSASAQGMLLVLISLLTWGFAAYFEQFFHPDTTRSPDDFALLLLFTLPLGLWAGGIYSHFTRLESGKWSRTKRSLMGMLSGFLGGSLAGFLGSVTREYVGRGYWGYSPLDLILSDPGTFISTALVFGGTAGHMSLFGALVYIFELDPWAEGKLSRKTVTDWLRTWWVRGLIVTTVSAVLGIVLLYFEQGYMDSESNQIIISISIVLGVFGPLFYPHKVSYILTAIFGVIGAIIWFPLIDSLPMALWFGLGSGFIWSAIISRILYALKKITPRDDQDVIVSSVNKPDKKTIKDWLQIWWVRGLIVTTVSAVLGIVLISLEQGYMDSESNQIIIAISIVLGVFGLLFYPHKSSFILTVVLGSIGAFIWFPGVNSLPLSIWFGLGSGFILSAIISRILHALKKI